MGLLAGVEFKVINNGHPGPLVIDLKGSRIILGRGMAGKIIVKPSES
jgi:ferrous iron transport protein A